MSIIVSNCQHSDEQQFRTHVQSCVHYTIFSVVKSDLFIRALLLDCIIVTEKATRTPRVHLVNIYSNGLRDINFFLTNQPLGEFVSMKCYMKLIMHY